MMNYDDELCKVLREAKLVSGPTAAWGQLAKRTSKRLRCVRSMALMIHVQCM